MTNPIGLCHIRVKIILIPHVKSELLKNFLLLIINVFNRL